MQSNSSQYNEFRALGVNKDQDRDLRFLNRIVSRIEPANNNYKWRHNELNKNEAKLWGCYRNSNLHLNGF